MEKEINKEVLESGSRVYGGQKLATIMALAHMMNPDYNEPRRKYNPPKTHVDTTIKLHKFTFNRNGKIYEIDAVDKKRALKKLENILKQK